MASLGELFVTVGAKIDGFEAGMRTVSQSLDKIDRDAQKATSGFDKLGDRLTTIGMGLTASMTVPMLGLGAAVISVAGKMEQAEIAFKTLLGSAEKATAMLNELKAFAASTPFEFPDLIRSAKSMMALGFSAKEVIPMLRIIGDAASALGLQSEGIDRITRALGQMRMAGRVTAQDMNQLTDAGIKGWQYLADEAGKSVAEIRTLSETGMLDGAKATQTILLGMQRDFAGTMTAQSQTLLGQWSNFKDKISFTLMDLGKVLLPVAKDILAAMMPLVGYVQELAKWFSELSPTAKTLALTMAGLAVAIGPVTMALGLFVSSASSIVAAMTAISTVVGVSVIPALSALPAMIGSITTALGAGMVGALTAAEMALLAVGVAAAGAAAIFAGWKLGQWAYQNIPALKQLGDAMADLLLKIPGVVSIMDRLSGVTGKQADASKDLDFATKKLVESLAKKGIVINSTGLSTEQYAAKLREAAKQATVAIPPTKELTGHTSLLGGAQTKGASAARTLNEAQAALAKAIKAQNDEMVKARTAHLEMSVTWQVLIAHANQLTGNVKTLTADIVRLTLEIEKNPTSIDKMVQSFDELVASMAKLGPTVSDAARAIAPIGAIVQQSMDGATGGIEKMFTTLQEKTAVELPKVVSRFQTMKDDISATISRLGQDMIRSLFDGDGSFVQKGVEGLKDLGTAVLTHFVDPATKAIGDFIGNSIAALLGEGGFGGVQKAAEKLGKTMTDTFGGAASTATGGAGGATKATTGASTSAGMAGMVSMLTGIADLISSIIGNFQMAGMNKSLDILVKHTLQLVMIGQAMFDGVTLRMNEILDRLYEMRTAGVAVFTTGNPLSVRFESEHSIVSLLVDMHEYLRLLSVSGSLKATATANVPDARALQPQTQGNPVNQAVVNALSTITAGQHSYQAPQPIYLQVDGRTIATATMSYIENRMGAAV